MLELSAHNYSQSSPDPIPCRSYLETIGQLAHLRLSPACWSVQGSLIFYSADNLGRRLAAIPGRDNSTKQQHRPLARNASFPERLSSLGEEISQPFAAQWHCFGGGVQIAYNPILIANCKSYIQVLI